MRNQVQATNTDRERMTRLWRTSGELQSVVVKTRGSSVGMVTVRQDSNPLLGGWIVRGRYCLPCWFPTLRRALDHAVWVGRVKLFEEAKHAEHEALCAKVRGE